jgi:hypothetical protein
MRGRIVDWVGGMGPAGIPWSGCFTVARGGPKTGISFIRRCDERH